MKKLLPVIGLQAGFGIVTMLVYFLIYALNVNDNLIVLLSGVFLVISFMLYNKLIKPIYINSSKADKIILIAYSVILAIASYVFSVIDIGSDIIAVIVTMFQQTNYIACELTNDKTIIVALFIFIAENVAKLIFVLLKKQDTK